MATTPEGMDTAAARRFAPAQIALGVLGVFLVLFLLWFLVLRGDGEEEVPAPAAPAPAASPEEEPVDGEDGRRRRRGPVETFEVFAPKDPFDPLISAATADGTAADGTATGDGTAAGDGTAGDGTGTTTTNGNGTGTTTTNGGRDGGEDVGGHRVSVIDVFQQGGQGRAQVRVDGTVYTVDEGERFAANFQLMSTSGQCATMLFGDDEFTLCEGEEILK